MTRREPLCFNLVTITVALTCLWCFSEGTVFSSKMLKRMESGPNWVDLRGGIQDLVQHKSRFWHHRLARSVIKEPTVKQSDLGNDTTHNQALIHWSGGNSTVVFILTRKKVGSAGNRITESTLWRSEDYGSTFNSMMNNFYKNTTLKSYFVCPTNKSKMIFIDSYANSRRIWISLNEGKSYSLVTVPFSIEKIEFHPSISEWLLGYDKIMKELYCSIDFGKTWTKLHDEVTSERYYWYIKDVDVDENANKIIHFEYRNIYVLPNRVWQVKTCYIPHCRETGFQKNYDALENIDMDSLVVQDDYIFVQKSGALNKLYVSYKRGPFVKAHFPYYSGQMQSHFHVVSSDGKCVVIGVNHINGLTHLFFSNLEGDTYSQSLSNVRYFNRKTADKKVYTVDIHEVQGIIGTYIANVHKSDGEGYNVTQITWDNGRSWANISSANLPSGNKMSSCSGCTLNLHLMMDQTKSGYYMPSILSKKSVPGLILAHGTLGRTLEDNPNRVALFISTDNGMSWKKTRDSRHLIVIANYGAILVCIPMIFLSPVNSLYFSGDEGNTWQSYKFTEDAVNVDGVLTEPDEQTHFLTLFGHITYKDSWRIFQLDMSPVFETTCKQDDFEIITIPAQIQSNTCHLGVVQKVERLKENSFCLINKNYSRIQTTTICDCTDDDYECDLGYENDLVNNICKPVRSGLIDTVGEIFTTAKNCANKLTRTGFRKVPGNRCQNELKNKILAPTDCKVPATPLTPTTPTPKLKLQLVNKTKNAKIGENLFFSVQGADESVVWTILRPEDKRVITDSSKNLTLIPKIPGPYKVQASSKEIHSNTILVEFWYPIEKIYLYNPPVVATNAYYNATVRVQTVHGLRGNKTLLGEVTYIWQTASGRLISTPSSHLNSLKHSKVSSLMLQVTAENTVSTQSTSGKIKVGEFIEQLIVELKCTPEMTSENLSDVWLEEFKEQFEYALFTLHDFVEVAKTYNLHNGVDLFVYIPPSEKLRVYIYLFPLEHKTSTKTRLLQSALDLEKAIANGKISIPVANGHVVTVTNQYVVDHDGTVHAYGTSAGSNAAVIVIGVIIAIILIVLLVFVFRRVSRRIRFDRYLHFRNFRGGSGGAPHIVRNQDRNPIVDEEFIDDDLDNMEGIGSQDATLQFQG